MKIAPHLKEEFQTETRSGKIFYVGAIEESVQVIKFQLLIH